jgi:hypothetical protein
LAKLDFSPQQERIILKVKEYLEAVVAARNNPHLQIPTPFKIILTGGPGTGKSFVIETICDLVKWLKIGKVTTSSWNGIAVVNIDGSTLCSLLNIRPTDRKASSVEMGYIAPIASVDTLQKMRNSLNPGQMCIFVIDEVSTTDGICIATVDARMKTLMGNDKISVVLHFVGDTSSLGSSFGPHHDASNRLKCRSHQKTNNSPGVSDLLPLLCLDILKLFLLKLLRTIATWLHDRFNFMTSKSLRDESNRRKQKKMKKVISSYGRYGVNSTLRRGASLFSQCERIHLSTQQRAQDDHEHTAFIDKLSEGKQITMDDLNRYKKLSKSDLNDTSSPWAFAPILVSSNKERIDICQRKSLLFAKHHSTYIFKWRSNIISWKNKPTNVGDRQSIIASNGCFWETFVPQADAFLTYNVNNDLGLANGSPVSMHSMSFSSDDQLLSVLSKIDSLPPLAST